MFDVESIVINKFSVFVKFIGITSHKLNIDLEFERINSFKLIKNIQPNNYEEIKDLI